MEGTGRIRIFILGLLVGVVAGAAGTPRADSTIPGASQVTVASAPEGQDLDVLEAPPTGRYQAVATSATMGSGLPWYGVWVVDTATGAVKWVDHPDAGRRSARYGMPFSKLSAQPAKAK